MTTEWLPNDTLPEWAERNKMARVYYTATPPVSPKINELWISSSDGIMCAWTGTEWVEVGHVSAVDETTLDPRYVNVTGDTMTGVLQVNPRIDIDSASGAGELRFEHNNIPRFIFANATNGDKLNLYRYNSAGSYIDAPISVNENGKLVIAGPNGAGQAAQVSAYNTVTGQLAVSGYEIGDTGWRDIGTLVLNGWVAAPHGIKIRRVGNVVTMMLISLNGTAQTNAQFLDNTAIMVGFRPNGWMNYLVPENPGADTPVVRQIYVRSDGGAVGIGLHTFSLSIYTSLTWLTKDSWPTSLPGTAG